MGVTAGSDSVLRPRQPKVHQFDTALREHDVRGLQITVDDASRMRRRECIGCLAGDPEALLHRQRFPYESGCQRLSLDKLHHEKLHVLVVNRRGADVVEGANMRMH